MCIHHQNFQQYTNKLTESEINTIEYLLDSYFQAYEITIGEEWNSGVVIWQMFIVSTPDDISRELAEEAIENYNNVLILILYEIVLGDIIRPL